MKKSVFVTLISLIAAAGLGCNAEGQSEGMSADQSNLALEGISPDAGASDAGASDAGADCREDADCEEGVCEYDPAQDANVCVPGCREDADCGEGQFCQEVVCITAPCPPLCVDIPAPDFLSFEDETLQWTSTGSIDINDNASHGEQSLEISECGWMEVNSPEFSSQRLTEVDDALYFDVFVPVNQSNPWWVGDIGLLISIPSAGIYHQWIGQVLLNDLERGVWSEGEIALPTNVLEALQEEHNVILHLAVNTGSCAEPILIDNLRFADDENVPPVV